MGIVQRQSLKQSAVIYVGVMMGFVSTTFIYPLALTTEQIGLFRAMITASAFITPFIFLGGSAIVVRFFPEFKTDDGRHNGFLFFLFALQGFGFILFLLLLYLFEDRFFTYFSEKNQLFEEYLYWLPVFLFLVAFANLLTSFTSNFRRIAVPAVFNELFVKFGVPLCALLYYFEVISFTGFIQGLALVYLAVNLGLAGYLRRLGQLHFRPSLSMFTRDRIKRMRVFAGYGLLGSLGGKFVDYIDIIMLAWLSTLDATGIYSVPLLISNVIDVPRRSVTRIAAPVLTTHWQDNNRAEIASIYRKSSLLLLIAGAGLFLPIWAGIDELYAVMPNGEDFMAGKYVLLILGAARLVDMVTGVNSEIINYSPFFRWNFYLILLLAVFNVGTNYLLIPAYQIHGAALATLLSLTLYNFSKFLVVWYKIGLQPLTVKTLEVIAVFLLLLAAVSYLPGSPYAMLDLFWQPVCAIGLFGLYMLWRKPSEDADNFLRELLQKVRTYF